jgi:MFS transporter, SP family, galactose:H+ symporter
MAAMDHPVSLGAAKKIPQGRARGSPADPPLPADRPAGQSVTPWLMVVLIVVLFSGGLFGYDQGVISGALHGIKARFSLSPLIVEMVTSWVTLGALFGALAGGELADRIGRQRAVLIAGALFTLGSLVQALAPETVILVAGRLIVGAGVGVAAVAAPLYAAELAPTSLRGRFVSAYQLAITVGIFLAYLVDGWLSKSDSWRLMLGASAVPGLLLFVVALVAPESPRWLMKMNRRADAAMQIRKIRPGVEFKPRLDAIETALRQEAGRASWGDVFRREWRRPLMIGVGLAVFQQITGINAIIYYADQIFEAAGFISQSSQTTVTTWAIGGVNVLATLIAVAYIDRLGRRKLLLAGLIGMGGSLAVVGIAFQFIAKVAAGRRLDRADRGRDCHLVRTGRFHNLLRLVDGAGHLDRDQRSLPRAHPRPRRRGRHGGQLGRGVPGQSVLPVADRGDGNFMDLRAVRAVLRRRLDMDLLPCAGDKRTVSGTDPTALEADVVRPIAGDIGGAIRGDGSRHHATGKNIFRSLVI